MNIKDWKQFSDAVDKTNTELIRFVIENNKELIEYGFLPTAPIEKTEINFWEWKSGKLKLR